jgi:signal transduction histidine kinase
VELDLYLDEGGTIDADGDQLWQAVLNLIRNGLEAMPDGGRLSIESRRETGFLVLRLADTGCGMSELQLSRLFVPFATTKANGTGLGLPLVHQIVAEHGGRIECSSIPGRGTAFTLYLPIKNDFRNTEEVEHLAGTLAYT